MSESDAATTEDPRDGGPGSPPPQEQDQPGRTGATRPRPDHGERSYVGAGRLSGLRALVTGGDSGIGRAVAIAFAREGADVAIAYLPDEAEDASETLAWIERAGRRSFAVPGDLTDRSFAAGLPSRVVEEFGGLDVLVLNAAYQRSRDAFESTPSAEIERVVATNLLAPIWTAQAAIPLLDAGSSIIVTTSIQAAHPSHELFDYAMTKAAQVSLIRTLAEELGPRGIRVNGVAPGPIWTPLIPATGWPDHIPEFGKDTPLGRAGQPAEVAPAYVLLASTEAAYMSGGVVPVTGGKAF